MPYPRGLRLKFLKRLLALLELGLQLLKPLFQTFLHLSITPVSISSAITFRGSLNVSDQYTST
jgi:hypothetical protein